MRRALTVAITLLGLAGCSERTPLLPSADPYEKWRSLDLHNYSIDQTLACFCMNGGEAMRVVVRADTISSVKRLSDGSTLPYESWRQYQTIDALFAVIKNPGQDSLVIAYDPTYGFPQTLDINPHLHPVDGGVLYATSNLQIP